jgi:uncharacterized protein (TIGR03437 family)
MSSVKDTLRWFGVGVCVLAIASLFPMLGLAQAPGTVIIEVVEPYMATSAPESLYEIPVAIIRYLPTQDGVNIDTAETGASTTTLEMMRRRIDRMNRQVKFMLEEGSRFRAYTNSLARPSLGYRVMANISVYAALPKGRALPGSTTERFPDYAAILNRFDARKLVNELGVKEFWLWGYHTATTVPSESKMSSAVTGDISNSYRFNDLPVLDQTYTLYNYNFNRSAAEAVHNHGHQFEAILSFVATRQDGNDNLFWRSFVGRNTNGTHSTGRAGWTHMPPNSTVDYDYNNMRLVESDIENWTPASIGPKKPVNGNTWGTRKYAWPNGDPAEQIDAYWYLYWMQSMPGRESAIPNGNERITNWWTFTGDWDAAIRGRLGLHGPADAYSLSPSTWQTPLEGGSGSIKIEGAGGAWIAVSNQRWLKITTSSFGTGAGSVGFTAGANPSLDVRRGTLAIAGHTFSVAQPARSCIVQFEPSATVQVPTGGNTVTLRVQVSPSDCQWSMAPDASWLHILSGSQGVGNGSATINIEPNLATTPRSGTLKVGQATLSISQSAAVARPAIATDGGIRNGASLALSSGVSATSWVTIFGTNFTSVTRSWTASDFVGNRMPTELDGIGVLVNGQRAYIAYISPTQINALLRVDVPTGLASIEVVTPLGRTEISRVNVVATSPALFLFLPENRKYAAAVHNDGTLAGRRNLFGAGIATRPASPGETILLYGTGFGRTDPPMAEGVAIPGVLPLARKPQVWVADQPAEVQFAGMIAPGLFQFNIRIPVGTASGDQTVTVIADEVSSPTTFISVE